MRPISSPTDGRRSRHPHPAASRTPALALLGILLAGCAPLGRATPPGPPPPLEREFRGVWVASVANIDWPSRPGLPADSQRAELLTILDRAAELRLNAVILQVRPAGDALYASRYEPWSEYLTGAMGRPPEPEWDPLAVAIEEAHSRGLELHAWFNPYRARHPSAESPASEDHISRQRPDLVVRYGSYEWMDPGEPEVQDHSIRVIMDVVRRYAVDGIHIDDYFYPYRERDSEGRLLDFPDSASWERYRAGGGTLERSDWRRQNVDRFVARLYQEIKREKPWVQFGVSPIGIWRPGHPPGTCCFDAYEEIYADARKWFAEGSLDYFVPQLYRPIADTLWSFPVMLDWWAEQNEQGRHLWPGMIPNRVRPTADEDGWPAEEILQQIDLARRHPAAGGHVHFSARSLLRNHDGLSDALRDPAYGNAAIPPASPWLAGEPAAVPLATLDAGQGILNLAPAGAEQPRWWVVRSRRGGAAWTVDIVPGSQSTVVPQGSGPIQEVAVSAVDRTGNESPVLWLGPEAALTGVVGLTPYPSARPEPGAAGLPGSDLDRDAWVEGTLAGLSLREKVGQLMMPWLDGAYLPLDGEAHERLRDWVETEGIGGVVVSVGAPLAIAAKLNALQDMAPVPLLVAADLEAGPGHRMTGGVALPWGFEMGGATQFPPVMGLGAAGDERLAYEMGRITAVEARAVGIHMVFAPVLDVNNNPANPIINTRSYGQDPALVSRMGVAHLRGLQDHGVMATAKHFPGHGDTDVDSHIALPVISHGRDRVDRIELVPFRAAIDAGVGAIMTAHIAFPSLTGDSLPATLHPRILTGLLRQELGFDGIVSTDALDMGGIVEEYGGAEAAVLALQAGADLLLMPADVRTAIDGVVEAVRRGELDEERVDRSVRKLLRAKADAGLHRERRVPLDRVAATVGASAHLAVAREAAERAMTLVRDRDGLIPASPSSERRVLSIVYTDDPDPLAGRTFRQELDARFPRHQSVRVDGRTHPDHLADILAAADTSDLVVFAPFVRVAAWKGELAIPEPVTRLVRQIAERRPTVAISFGSPYLISELPEVGTYLAAWGQVNGVQQAAARALAGEIPIGGRLPIPIPPDHQPGEGLQVERSEAASAPPREGT